MVIPCRHPRIVVRYDAAALRISVWADMNLPRIRVENGGNLKANFVHNNAEGSRKTSQG